MASLRRHKDAKGSYWEVRWRGPDGEHKKRRRNKTAADHLFAWALDQESRRRDPLAYRAVSDVSLGFVIDHWWNANVESWQGTTRASREGMIANHIPPAWKSRPIRHIRPSELQSHFRSLSQTLASSTVGKVRSILKLVFDHGVLEEWLDANPVLATSIPRSRGAKAPSVLDPVDPREVLDIAQVRQIADRIDHEPYRVLVLTLGDAGLRIGEAVVLQVKHVDLKAGTLYVEQARDAAPKRHRANSEGIKETKGEKPRTVTLSESLRQALRPLVEGRDPESYVFTSQRGKPVSVDNFRSRIWDPVVSELGFRHGPREFVTPHWLRHTAASVMLKSGLNPAVICNELGWDDINTFFEYYAGFFASDKEEVRAARTKAWVPPSAQQPREDIDAAWAEKRPPAHATAQ